MFWNTLPGQLFQRPYSSILLSQSGDLLAAHIAKDEQWRFPEIKKVPAKFRQSIIHYEDKRFMNHIGIDPLAIARAIKLNLKKGKVVSGGSTLTMQVIRLSKDNPPRTFWEKIKEALLAIRIEVAYSKSEILNLYASHAPFGGNVVGLEAASWRYFARTPEQLSWAESAMLAVLPNSPALIHPGKNRERLAIKRNTLLKRLFNKSIIDQLTYELAIQEPLPEKPHALPMHAHHLLETLKKQYPDQSIFQTSINPFLQKQLNTISKQYTVQQLKPLGVNNLAILVIDNKTFKVLAYVANAPYSKHKEHGTAIDLIQAQRSTGSTLKPFLFASMLQAGEVLPETLIADVPVHYSGFMPKNYNRQYRGAVRAKYALAHSLNIPAVNMLSQHGVARFQAFLKHMGMQHLNRSPDHYGLSLILGGAEGSLWEITQLYANLAWLAQRDYQEKNIKYHKAKTIKRQYTRIKRESDLSPATAWLTLNSLLDVSRPGSDGYWKKFSSSRKIAWKTGTSFGYRDAWAIGTTPEYTVGTWVGNADGAGNAELTGTQLAAPLMLRVFNQLPETTWFKKPKHQLKTINICREDGFLSNSLCDAIPYEVPITVNFKLTTPHFARLHLDHSGQYQVHSQCESPQNMQHVNWFILPPDQAYYYQQYQTNYRTPPPYRADCLANNQNKALFSIVYPKNQTEIYIPIEIDNTPGKVVLKVLSHLPEQILYWHLNDRFIGTTQTFHQQAVYLKKGKYKLTVVDENGQSQSQTFVVLNN